MCFFISPLCGTVCKTALSNTRMLLHIRAIGFAIVLHFFQSAWCHLKTKSHSVEVAFWVLLYVCFLCLHYAGTVCKTAIQHKENYCISERSGSLVKVLSCFKIMMSLPSGFITKSDTLPRRLI